MDMMKSGFMLQLDVLECLTPRYAERRVLMIVSLDVVR